MNTLVLLLSPQTHTDQSPSAMAMFIVQSNHKLLTQALVMKSSTGLGAGFDGINV